MQKLGNRLTFSTAAAKVPATNIDIQLEQLRQRINGELITRSSPSYDDVRQTHDLTNDARPLAIVRATNEADVAITVQFVGETGIPLAIRSGGHSVSRHSMVDDALVIDLSRMKQITIDAETQTARAQAGLTSGELCQHAVEHGLALSTGDTASVGLGGLTTGGGIGFMVRKHGLTIDNLLSARVVTAKGEIVTASANENPDLFWAIRGGGGNFGIVTELELRLAPVGQILGGDLVLPLSRDVVRGFLDYAASAPDDLTLIGNVMPAPPAPFVPAEWIGRPVLMIIVTWTGSIEEGQRALAPLRALATPVADTVRPMPYPDIYMSTQYQEQRMGIALHSMFANAVGDDVIDSWLAAVESPPSPFSLVHLRGLGGAMAQVASDATAFAHRSHRLYIAIICAWMDPTQDAMPQHAWADGLWRTMRDASMGAYVGFLQQDDPELILDAYPPATHARLRAIKAVWDPENLFRFNHNIAPEG